MRSCPACQYENPDDAPFCAQCQASLGASTPSPPGAGVHVGGDAGVVRVHDESHTINNITISIAPQKLADLLRVSGQESGAGDDAERLALSGGALASEIKLDLDEFVVGADELAGWSDERILRNFPTLRPTDLHNAWAYVGAHLEEIEQAIRRNEDA